MSEKFIKRVLPALVIVVGILIMFGMKALKTDPEKKPAVKVLPLVKVLEATAETVQLKIEGSGSVRSVSEIALVPQVGGKIIYRSKSMISGGFFNKGDVLYEIDPRDYQLNYEVAAAEVARQEVQIKMEEQENRIAKEEWAHYKEANPEESASELTLRKPQMELAQANLKAAQARLRIAKLALDRTKLRAPFNGTVRTKRMDVGQFVSPGMNLADILSTERSEIEVTLDPKYLQYFDFASSPKAKITRSDAASDDFWIGKILQGGGSLDMKSRLMTVTVGIDAPYAKKPALITGLYVNLELEGKAANNVVRVPRHAVHDGKIWLFKDGKLVITKVSVLKFQDDFAIVEQGIQNGDKIIVTDLDYAVDGMRVKVEI
jgi:RND family efflux transporter MFP subunit